MLYLLCACSTNAAGQAGRGQREAKGAHDEMDRPRHSQAERYFGDRHGEQDGAAEYGADSGLTMSHVISFANV
ncbi:MAG TPA: hypothetical protein VNZ59_19070 [Burkholderiales bacterium]|jgi:hypothetical protein|nr:hypothetical protein [Burkholderiales bacterium]